MSIENRKARHDYELIDRIEAGLELNGSEVKSLRAGKGSLQEAYCFFKKEELFIKNMHIATYQNKGFIETEPRRLRKLLLHRKELNKWKKRVQEKGLTLVPLKLFFNKKGWAKLQVGLGKGKKQYDKRQALRKKEDLRNLARLQKQNLAYKK